MDMLLILAYATTGLSFFVYSLYHLAVVERKRERWVGGADLVLLGGVALLSSAAWAVLLPVYALGWLRSEEGHRQLERVRSLGGLRRGRTDSVTVGC